MQRIRPYKKMCAAVLIMFSLSAASANAAITRDGEIDPANVEPFEGYGIVYDRSTGSGAPDNNGLISAKLEYRIFFSDGNFAKKLMNPVVIVDGFDPGDERKIPELSSTYNNFIENLNSQGFDVVLVNHPVYTAPSGIVVDGGADYIERNALGHVRLIQKLNTELITNGSTNELVIVGPSMGGQITRYALAYMEKNGFDHRTRLWISIDSPHHGANIAIGLQKMIHTAFTRVDIAQTGEVRDMYYGMLHSFAAQQQLIELHNPDRRFNEYAYLNNGSPVRQRYMQMLEGNGLPGSNGYPMNLRKIAMVNGSLLGTKNDIEAEENLRVHGFIKKQLFGTTFRKDKILEANTHYMPAYGSASEISRFWVQAFFSDRSSVTNNNSNGSMDVVPGGYTGLENLLNKALVTDLSNDVNGGAEEGINMVVSKLKLFGINGDIANRIKFLQDNVRLDVEPRVNKMNHTHIPTYSSLGIINPSGDWSRSLNRNLVCTGETPFDSYYAPRENQEHTSFNDENERWLMSEVRGLHQPPSVYPRFIDTGSTLMCGNEQITLSVDRCKVPEPPIWAVDPGLSIVSSTPYSVTVKAAPTPFRGHVGIEAGYRYWKTRDAVYVGSPQPPSSVTGPTSIVKDSIVTYQSGKANGATSYKWFAPYPYSVVSNFGGISSNWQIKTSSTRSLTAYTGLNGNAGAVQAMGVNRCGVGGARILNVTQSNSNSGGSCNLPICPVDDPDSGIR